MNLFTSILATIVIAMVIWFAVTLQQADAPTQEDKFASNNMSYEQMSEAGYLLVAQRLESQQTQVKQIEPKPQTKQAKPKVVNQQPNNNVSIVGISDRIQLTEANITKLWQKLNNNNKLTQQLTSNRFTIYAIYHEFNADYSQANVVIGYNAPAMQGNQFNIPSGDKTMLLDTIPYSATAISQAWQHIDYSRPLKAVIEQHKFNNDKQTVSISVVYQEEK